MIELQPLRGRPPILRASFDLSDDELVVDSFAGGGGASTGIEAALGRPIDIAINHDPEAIALHKENHPTTHHVCGNVWDVNPAKLCAGRRVGFMWLSPDCTFHSKARGGKPFRDRKEARGRRGLAWVAIRWAKAVKPRVIMLENVEEFADWGPLLPDGKPCPARRGLTFRVWIGKLRAAGYIVEWRELRACDYGAPTIRKRLFVIARCDGQPIVWPAESHGPRTSTPYRTAAECISWELPCPSIFERKKPLAEKTLARIARGIQRFVLNAATPFIVPTTHGGDRRVHSIDEPVRTITTRHRGEFALVASSLTKYHGGDRGAARGQGLDEPIRTLDTSNRFGLIGATLIQTGYGERPGQAPRAPGLDKPLGTIIAGGTGGNGKHALVSAFLAKHYGGHESSAGGTGAADPVSTITTKDHHTLVAASMVKLMGSCRDGQDLRAPAPTVRARGTHLAEVRAFLTRFNRTGEGQSAQLPLGTVTIAGDQYEIADIGLRMLSPRELYRAQGFPEAYAIDIEVDGKPLTKGAQVRMCGNSVPPDVAQALVAANVPRARAAVA